MFGKTMVRGLLTAAMFACLHLTVNGDTMIFCSWNEDGTYNQPTLLPVFNISESTTITRIADYHFNDGLGKDPTLINGTIGIIEINSGTQVLNIGTWPAQGAAGPGYPPDCVWNAYPDLALLPGTYAVVDSDPASWSYTTTDTLHYLGGTGANWQPYEGFSEVYAVPEPSTLVLLGVGAIGLLGYTWRWRQRKARA